MTSEDRLLAWRALDQERRTAILAALQAVAETNRIAAQSRVMGSLLQKPVIEVFAATSTRDSLSLTDTLVAHFLYAFRLECLAQSGSDWDEQHVHIGEVTCKNGGIERLSITRHEVRIHERDTDSYDEKATIEELRAAAITALAKFSR